MNDAHRPRLGTLAAAAFAALATVTLASVAQPRLLTVPQVDPQRYAGTWHEVARLPNRFQAQCAGDVSAVYTPREDGRIAVVNRCRTTDGGTDVVDGLATPLDATNARLRVSFLPAGLRWLPFGRGDYYVIELDPEYRWAMVGDPDRKFLWVLARDTRLPPDVLQPMLGRAREAGFPVDKVVPTPQGAASR